MANDKLIIYLIVLFIVYNLFLKKESFRFTTGQVNYGTIDIYAVDVPRSVNAVATNPQINKLVISPDISSISTVSIPTATIGATRPIEITNLSPNFNTRSLSITCHSINEWKTPNKKIINDNFGDNIKVEYDNSLNKLLISGLTFNNLQVPLTGFPKTNQPVLIATLVLTWVK